MDLGLSNICISILNFSEIVNITKKILKFLIYRKVQNFPDLLLPTCHIDYYLPTCCNSLAWCVDGFRAVSMSSVCSFLCSCALETCCPSIFVLIL